LRYSFLGILLNWPPEKVDMARVGYWVGFNSKLAKLDARDCTFVQFGPGFSGLLTIYPRKITQGPNLLGF
jgi:hypothetical protein